jgi:sulfopyruvate decarboxylase TPP-binding subunit
LIANDSMLTANKILDQLKDCGITHIVWLPDSESRFMYDSLLSRKEFTLVPVCREGEAIAIAMGLLLGGKKAVVLHQNTGFFESGDSVRGLALDLHLPLLLLIGYRGWRRDCPITDSAALFTEPILKAWNITHYLVENDRDTGKIAIAYEEAHKTQKPVVILIGTEYK